MTVRDSVSAASDEGAMEPALARRAPTARRVLLPVRSLALCTGRRDAPVCAAPPEPAPSSPPWPRKPAKLTLRCAVPGAVGGRGADRMARRAGPTPRAGSVLALPPRGSVGDSKKFRSADVATEPATLPPPRGSDARRAGSGALPPRVDASGDMTAPDATGAAPYLDAAAGWATPPPLRPLERLRRSMTGVGYRRCSRCGHHRPPCAGARGGIHPRSS